MIGALIWKGGTRPTLARWCFSSGRGEEKSTALLITLPQIKVLLHQSSNSHQRADTSLQSFRLGPSFPVTKPVSASGISLPKLSLPLPEMDSVPKSTSTGSLCGRRNARDGAFVDGQPGWFIWDDNTALVTDYRITAPQIINHVLCKQENLTDLKIRVTCK